LTISFWPGHQVKYFICDGRFDVFGDLLRPYMQRAGRTTCFSGNPSGVFEYVTFYTDASTLLDMAKDAICIGYKATAWMPGAAYAIPELP
jgi:hypothetical protein